MGYGRALLQKDVRSEEASLRKKSKKKGLWGSIGRTIGSLGAMAISGGTLNPVTVGLLSGGASFLGGAIGSKAAGGKLTGGKFFKEERADLQRELGGFGSKNIVEALKGGVTAGIGQAVKLYGAGTKAAEAGATAEEVSAIRKGVSFGESFKGSMVGKGLQKAKLAAGNVSEFNVQKPLDQSYEFGVGARGGSAQIDLTAQDLSRSGKFMPSAKDLSGFGDPALERQLQLESLQSAGKKLPPDTPGIFPGKSMGDYFTGGKNLRGPALGTPTIEEEDWAEKFYQSMRSENTPFRSGARTVIGGK